MTDSYHPAFLVDVDTDIEMLTFEADLLILFLVVRMVISFLLFN